MIPLILELGEKREFKGNIEASFPKSALGEWIMPTKSGKRNLEEFLKKAFDLGFQYEKVYRGCSQCVLAAIQDLFQKKNDEVFRAASGLAGGVGLCGDGCCGAYTGGVMALSQLYGRTRENFLDPDRTRKKSFDLAKKLHDKFIVEYGSVICRDIQQRIFGRPFYIRDADESAKFEKAGAHEEKCPTVVGNGARWVAEILMEEANS
jgi:C_GCAxxG_C_C family probable redox protein